MRKPSRDFYHIQDQLPLAWRYSSNRNQISSPQLKALSEQIQDLASSLVIKYPELSEFIDLSKRKIALLERAAEITGGREAPDDVASDEVTQRVEVSLSSSGMGFFSGSLAEDDARVEVSLMLETIDSRVEFSATVIECRLSADSEKPGYWIRVRFARNQDQQINKLLAHVSQRQIERLERSSDPALDTEVIDT